MPMGDAQTPTGFRWQQILPANLKGLYSEGSVSHPDWAKVWGPVKGEGSRGGRPEQVVHGPGSDGLADRLHECLGISRGQGRRQLGMALARLAGNRLHF